MTRQALARSREHVRREVLHRHAGIGKCLEHRFGDHAGATTHIKDIDRRIAGKRYGGHNMRDDRRPLSLPPSVACKPTAHVVGRLPMMVMVIAMMVVMIVAVMMMMVIMVMFVMVVTVVVRMVVRLVGHRLLHLQHSPPRHAAGQCSPPLVVLHRVRAKRLSARENE